MSEPVENQDDPDIRLGSLALRSGWITPLQLREALSLQSQETEEGKMARQLGLILLSRSFVTEVQLQTLLNEQKARRSRLS
jgi:hypothetical protein